MAYCPICDRPFETTDSQADAIKDMNEHISGQHPEMDPYEEDL